MTDAEKDNVEAFYAEYYIYMRVPDDEVRPTDVIVDPEEVPSGQYIVD